MPSVIVCEPCAALATGFWPGPGGLTGVCRNCACPVPLGVVTVASYNSLPRVTISHAGGVWRASVNGGTLGFWESQENAWLAYRDYAMANYQNAGGAIPRRPESLTSVSLCDACFAWTMGVWPQPEPGCILLHPHRGFCSTVPPSGLVRCQNCAGDAHLTRVQLSISQIRRLGEVRIRRGDIDTYVLIFGLERITGFGSRGDAHDFFTARMQERCGVHAPPAENLEAARHRRLAPQLARQKQRKRAKADGCTCKPAAGVHAPFCMWAPQGSRR